jgi:radical SAM superfamily enzyme YgiQ (UPF0313 family)
MEIEISLAADVAKPSGLIKMLNTLRGKAPHARRLLFIQIPQVILNSFDRNIALQKSYYAFPPTGLQYLSESIKHRNLEVQILDLNFELLRRVAQIPDFQPTDWPTILKESLDRFQPDIVGVSCLFDMGIRAMVETLEIVKQKTSAIVITGGVIASYEWRSILSRQLSDLVVKGEGENKLNFILDHITDHNDENAEVPGIYFAHEGVLRESVGLPDVVEVQGDLIDSYKLVPIREYCNYGSLNPYSRQRGKLDLPYAAIQFSRGCRAECTFCSVRDFMGRGVRARSVKDVMAEIGYLYENCGVRHLEWLDDDLLFFRHKIKELFRNLIEKQWDISWSANNGLIASSIDEEMFDLIQRSGCIGFKIGIETGNREMLKQVKKPGTHDKFLSFSKLSRKYPVPFVGGNFIVGLPKETFGQMMDSFRFALEMNLDWNAFTVCQMIRGASAFSEAGEYFQEQMETSGGNVKNFIPTRQSKTGEMTIGDNVRRNMKVFGISSNEVPNEDQVKEIWFAFNIIGNYICNRNLQHGGKPEKFIAWVETAQKAYPSNPYMWLFLAIAHSLLGHTKIATDLLQAAKTCVNTDYWEDRFSAFHLNVLIEKFSTSPDIMQLAIIEVRAYLLDQLGRWLALPRGEYPDVTEPRVAKC